MTHPGKMQNGVAVRLPPVTSPKGTLVTIGTELSDRDFWRTKTVDELAKEQGVIPIKNLSDLKIDWPEDESVDDLIALVGKVRH